MRHEAGDRAGLPFTMLPFSHILLDHVFIYFRAPTWDPRLLVSISQFVFINTRKKGRAFLSQYSKFKFRWHYKKNHGSVQQHNFFHHEIGREGLPLMT